VIRHVVLWKLNATHPEDRRHTVEGIRERLERLVGIVPGLVSLTVSADLGANGGNWDVLLLSEHDDELALAAYQEHPEHLKATTWIRGVVQSRAAVDARA
jgi:hypothetical protein